MNAISLLTRGYVVRPHFEGGQVTEVNVTVDPEDVEVSVEVEDELEVTVVVCD